MDESLTITLEGEDLESVKELLEAVVTRRGWKTAYIYFTAAVQIMDQITRDIVAETPRSGER
jgi:hypothetical protein